MGGAARRSARVACLLLVLGGPAAAQRDVPWDRPPWEGGFTRSLGQPPIWRPRASIMAGVHGEGDDRVGTGYAALGVSKAVGNPVVGLLSVVGEGWAGFRNVDVEGGGRAYLFSPFFRVGAGMDWDARRGAVDPLFVWSTPWRRGGILGSGTTIRIDYLPSRAQTVAIGITVPLFNEHAGRTRPFADHVSLTAPRPGRIVPETVDPGIDSILEDIRATARRINLLVTPFIDQKPQQPEKALRGTVRQLQTIFASGPAGAATTGGVEAEVRWFHRRMAEAFARAARGPDGPDEETGARLAALARVQLLDHVLFPYNRLLGQRKRGDRLYRFRSVAWAGFVRGLGQAEPEAARWQQIVHVFQTLLDVMEENRALARARWGDDRLVWLPLQYGLLPEEHATQAQLDVLVERAAGRAFTEGNRVSYLVNEQFLTELPRTIEAARDYHVLWVHDFRGETADGRPDRVASAHVATYLRALTRAVREYDQVGRLPVYIILLDQLYYEVNRTRLWFRLLEQPLDATVRLPRDAAGTAGDLEVLQDSLRAAVQASDLLRLETRQYGRAWLRNLVKVHINVTNPADYTFNSSQVVPFLGLPDNVMRDHRKIVFYDLSEDDPWRGAAIYTGMGVGEHYTGATWEDRALLLQGPAALSVRDAAIDLLRIHGFADGEIPWPLRPRRAPPSPPGAPPGGVGARVLEMHNGTGYARKEVDVAKATLYTLLPRGGVLKVPDSLWGSQLFGSMLLGAALRGCRVLVMAPSLASAPSAGWPQMARAYELLARLLVLQRELGSEIVEAGGLLKVGIYHPTASVGDLATRFGVFGPGRPEAAWFRELFAFPAAVDSVGARVDSILSASDFREQYLVEGLRDGDRMAQPKLHMKGHFVASREAWEAVVGSGVLAPLLAEYITLRGRTLDFRGGEVPDHLTLSERVIRDMDRVLRRGLAARPPPERDRGLLYLLLGSANQDYRSLMLDGEAMVVVSGAPALVGFFDFVVIAGQCRWVETLEELQALLPEPGNIRRLLARWIKTLL